MTQPKPRTETQDPRIATVSSGTSLDNWTVAAVAQADEIELSSEVARLADQLSSLRSELQVRPNIWNTSLVDLGEPGYTLRQPLPVVIREQEDTGEVKACSVELEVFGEGPTAAAALAQLKSAILDLYDELEENEPDTLGELPLTWLRILHRFVERDQE